MSFTIKPNGINFDDGNFTRTGGTTKWGVVTDGSDSTFLSVSAANADLWFTLDGVIDHLADPTPNYVNIRMSYSQTPNPPAAGPHFATTLYSDAANKNSPNDHFLSDLGLDDSGTPLWYSYHAAAFVTGGGDPTNVLAMTYARGTNTGVLKIYEIEYSDVQRTNSTDYPQAGAASVTMSGSAAPQTAFSKGGAATATMSAASTQDYTPAGDPNPLHTTTGSGEIVPVDVHTVNIVPDQGQRVAHVIIDGVDMGEIFTFTFSDDAADHIISVVFVAALTGATSYDLGFYQQGLNREDTGGPNPVESHPENNAANQPGPRGFVPQVRHFVPFPKDFI